MHTRIESNKEEKKIPEVDELDGQRQAVDGVGARVDQHVVCLDVRVHVPVCVCVCVRVCVYVCVSIRTAPTTH